MKLMVLQFLWVGGEMMRGTPFECSGLFHGTRGEILARAQVKPPESVCECLINLLNENPAEKDVIAIFRGWASINDVRAKMGLEPDVLPYSAQKLLLNPCSYSMELGETLCKEIVGGMANSVDDDESSFGVQCLIDYAFPKGGKFMSV